MISNLQIISGKYRGRKLALPLDARPTQNRARIALFNMLTGIMDFSQPFIVWDAFAGSGAFGIEFLSRFENATAIFTDNSKNAIEIINKNLNGLPNGRVSNVDTISVIDRYAPIADIVFIDPPYTDAKLGVLLVKKLSKMAKPGAIIVWEMENGFAPEINSEFFNVLKDKTYGRARFLILQKIEQNS